MSYHATDVCTHLDAIRAIARTAGEHIMRVYNDEVCVRRKADGSPVTMADMAAHRHIVAALAALTPEWPVISEEAAATPYAQRAGWRHLWLVDPLDGTKEFIHGRDEFTVNIALIDDGRPVLGVVHVPPTGRSYFACVGRGAFCADGEASPRRISAARYAGGTARVVASRSHAGGRTDTFLRRLAAREGEPRLLSMGSSLKFCLVAEGAADVYPRLGPTSEWDTAAAQCVVEQAGGRVVTLDNHALMYNKPSLLNPEFIVCAADEYPWTSLVNNGN